MCILQNLNISTKPMMNSSLDNVNASVIIEDVCRGGSDSREDRYPPDERYILFHEMSGRHLARHNFRPIEYLTTRFSRRP